MQVTLWGTRGSLAAPGPDTNRYGGNTCCVSVEDAEATLLVLDAGTGILRLATSRPALGFPELAEGSSPQGPGTARRVDILLTHLHLDHIQGLGFFGPLLQPGNEVHIWGPASTTLTLRQRLSRYLSPPLFPVYIREMPASVILHEVTDDHFEIGKYSIWSALVCHPDSTVGYRIEAAGKSLTYLPDHEPALGTRDFSVEGEWISGHALAKGSDLLIHDAQFTAEEYASRVGWGHSSIPQAFQFAALAETKHLVPFHHDPTHSDDKLDGLFEKTMRLMKPAFKVTPGAEGMVFDVR